MKHLSNSLIKSFIVLLALLCSTSTLQATEVHLRQNGIVYFIWYETDNHGNITVTNCYVGGHDPELSGNIIIPSNVTYEEKQGSRGKKFTVTADVREIGNGVFSNCKGLTGITIPPTIQRIGDSFTGCTNLKSISLPSSVTQIGGDIFLNCTSLETATMSNVETIPTNAFYNCTSLKHFTIPESVTTIGVYAFCNCTGLESVTIGEHVTEISSCAFMKCSSLTEVSIPSSVELIDYGAFFECFNLETINSYSPTPPECRDFDAKILEKATLHVPVGADKIYSKTYPWKNFKHIIADLRP